MTPEQSSLLQANYRLVRTMARRHYRPGGHLSLDDLIQEGNIGLLTAVARFEPARGFRFELYASWWIRHHIRRALDNKEREVRVPVEVLDLRRKMIGAHRQAEADGRAPGDNDLARAAGATVERLERLRHCMIGERYSLDTPVGDDGDQSVVDILPDRTTPDLVTVQYEAMISDRVRQLLGRLPPIEADVLRKRFGLERGEPMTLREIGEEYSLSRERIRQLQEQALRKIRRELRRHDLL